MATFYDGGIPFGATYARSGGNAGSAVYFFTPVLLTAKIVMSTLIFLSFLTSVLLSFVECFAILIDWHTNTSHSNRFIVRTEAVALWI